MTQLLVLENHQSNSARERKILKLQSTDNMENGDSTVVIKKHLICMHKVQC
jgi:hypothetical protein